MDLQALQGGFADPAREAAVAFRACLEAMARPGTIHRVAGVQPPAPLSVAAGVALLVLGDQTTPLYLAPSHDLPVIRDWITFHIGAPLVGRAQAAFALGTWADLLPLDDYPAGTAEYPDRSATLIVESPDLAPSGAVLRGPGIREAASLSLPALDEFRRNAALYPLGCDFLFTAGDRLAGLPRTTQVS